mgnify:CR=1 FL=1
MAKRKAFPLRISEPLYEELRRWADAELRSVNAQIEFLLVRALKEAGRLPRGRRAPRGGPEDRPSGPEDPPSSA